MEYKEVMSWQEARVRCRVAVNDILAEFGNGDLSSAAALRIHAIMDGCFPSAPAPTSAEVA